jgi:hypothetical protein
VNPSRVDPKFGEWRRHLAANAASIRRNAREKLMIARVFVDELERIIQCFELVHPTIGDNNPISESIENKRKLGFRIIRRSVARYGILGVTRLTYDRERQSPTAGRLIAALLALVPTDSAKNSKSFCSLHGTGKMRGHIPSALDIPSAEEIEFEVAENRQIFDDNISQLKDKWQWFSEHETTFRNIRDKRIAHLEERKYEDRYGPTEVQPLEWNLVGEALERLIEIAKFLSFVLGTESRDFDRFVRFAKTDAKDFWQFN